MQKNKIFLSTIAEDAPVTARKYGLGLEIADYCEARRMDELFHETDPGTKEKLTDIAQKTFHAAYSELFPCAIDPMIRDVARYRYRQAIALAQRYGADKVVIHGGYNPRIFFPCWYTEQSILFWREFMEEVPENMEIILENVLEEEPGMLCNILRDVSHPRLKMCLDVGHVNAYSKIPVVEWLRFCAPQIGHFHIHNNHGDFDRHLNLSDGTIPMTALLREAEQLCPDATYTLELMETVPGVRWLKTEGFLEE